MLDLNQHSLDIGSF